MDIGEIFSSMFGRPMVVYTARQRGRDIQLQMSLTLEEIATGVNKTISVDIGTGQNELLKLIFTLELKTDTKLDIEEEDNLDPVERGDLYILIIN